MKRPTFQAQFALEQFLVYQHQLDTHHFFSEADRQAMQAEADYWRNQYEAADDASVTEKLGLTVLPNP